MSDHRESINIGTTSLSFQSPEKEKKKIKYMREKAQTCFPKNYDEITLHLNLFMYINKIFVRIKADQHEQMSVLHKIAGKWRRILQQQTNKRQFSMKYQQQYICSRRKASKPIANHLNLDLLCVFSVLVKSTTGTRLRILKGFSDFFYE